MQCMPGMGDPTLAAHLTVAAYACAAIACALNAGRGRATGARALWAGLAFLLGLFGMVEHLDLHMTLLEQARRVVGMLDWRLGRGVVRLGLVAGLLAAVAAGAALLVLGRRWLDIGAVVTLGAVVGLVGFVAARTAFFDRLDEWVGFELAGPCSYRLGELAALALAFVGARISARRRGRPKAA